MGRYEVGHIQLDDRDEAGIRGVAEPELTDPLSSPQSMDDQTQEYMQEASSLIAVDPLRYTRFNPAQVRFFNIVRRPCETLTVCAFLKGNGLGGSYSLVAAWSAIMFGTQHRLFQGSPFGPDAWPFMKDIRLITTTESLGDRGPIQRAMHDLFPMGMWQQNRGIGKPYYSVGFSHTGFNWDILTYNQGVAECASHTKGLIMFSEPPPKDIFVESIARIRGRGMVLIDMTQLDMGDFFEELLDKGLSLDGQKVGEVRVVEGDSHEACRECHGGHRSHNEIMADIASWPEEEREARRTGKSLRLSGRIYPTWTDANELQELPKYHQDCWSLKRVRIASIIDPADRRPWAMAWFAVFPNEDVIAFAEWPPFDFNACKSSPVSELEDYRDIILETEAPFGRPVNMRFIDPLFGEAPGKGNARSLRTMLSSPCHKCLLDCGSHDKDEGSSKYERARSKCKHMLTYMPSLAYDGSVRDGHNLVRPAIGNPSKGVRPKYYAMKSACPNMCRGMRRYAWKEEKSPTKALSEKPALVYKDFPDLPRLGYLKQFEEWPAEVKPIDLWRPRVHGPGTVNP